LIVDADTVKHEQITGSDSCDSIRLSFVADFNSTNEMNEFSLQDKLLLRLILNLFRQPFVYWFFMPLGGWFAKEA